MISLRELLAVFMRIGLLSFGGPAGQIAVMHRILVEEKRWIGEHRFLHALNYCTLLPGPEAQQLCTYCGWLLRGTWGGIIAGALFVIPGVIALLACSLLYVYGAGLAWVDAIFAGVKPAVVALVIAALLRVTKKALRSRIAVTVAVLAFAALRLFAVPFPIVIAVTGVIGFWAGRFRGGWFPSGGHGTAANMPEPVIPESALTTASTSWSRLVVVGGAWTSAWLLPLAGITWWLGPDHVLSTVGWFFSKVAVITFGGAYALLPYITEHAVHTHGWIDEHTMIDGLGLAESTPGPLIMVVQFVGFLAGWHHSAGWTPLFTALAASAVTVWATFMPSYLWIFAGAPFAEKLRQYPPLASALSAITAAVVGVIANLALWFGLSVVFGPIGTSVIGILHLPQVDLAGFDAVAAALVVACTIALIRFRLGLGWVIAGSILVGGAAHLLRV